MSYKLKTAATSLVVSVSEAKSHLAVTYDNDDTIIEGMINAAIQHAQDYTNRQFCNATWQLYMDYFNEDVIKIFKTPVSSITSFKYYDTNNEEQTISSEEYVLDIASNPARLTPVYGESWPNTYNKMNAVCIEFVSGYGSSGANVPAAIRAAILLIVGHLYENRGDEGHRTIPKSVYDLLDPYRIIYFNE